MALPVTSEVNGLAALQRQSSNPLRLIAIRDAAIILTPRRLLRIA
jgi:hypothetical protein